MVVAAMRWFHCADPFAELEYRRVQRKFGPNEVRFKASSVEYFPKPGSARIALFDRSRSGGARVPALPADAASQQPGSPPVPDFNQTKMKADQGDAAAQNLLGELFSDSSAGKMPAAPCGSWKAHDICAMHWDHEPV